MLDWEGCFNVRDLGGLPTVDGRVTRSGALVRADTLTRLTEAGCAAARAHGVSAVIDLRSGPELADGGPIIRRLPTECVLDTAGPHPFCAADGVVYRQLRVREGTDEAFFERICAAKSQLEIYRMILRDGARPFATIAREVIAAPPGAAVLHCHVGKDRTGLIVAVLLAAVGVPDDVIAADYAVSAENLLPMGVFRRSLGIVPPSHEPADAHLSSPPETMLALLQELRAERGGAAAYLRAGGLTDEELAALRRRLVA